MTLSLAHDIDLRAPLLCNFRPDTKHITRNFLCSWLRRSRTCVSLGENARGKRAFSNR